MSSFPISICCLPNISFLICVCLCCVWFQWALPPCVLSFSNYHCAMDSMGSCGEVVFNHELLEFVLDYCCKSTCGWWRFKCRLVNWGAIMCLLPILASVLNVTWVCMGCIVQFAALWLAAHDVEVVGIKLSTLKKTEVVLQAFDRNVEFFSKSWRVNVGVPENL